MKRARGFTLVELIVVLSLFGLMLGISGLALSSLRVSEPPAQQELRAARAGAIRDGIPRTAHGVLFLPDGRAIGTGVDPMTGAPDAR